MNKIKFYEAIYASCNNIVARHRSAAMPLALIILGVLLPLTSMNIWSGAEYDDLNSAVVLIGIALAVAGSVWLLGRKMGGGVPYHTERGEFLTTRCLSFDRSARRQLLAALASGDVAQLLAVPTCEVSALTLLLASTKDNSVVVAQAFEYAELEYKQLSEVTILKK